MIFLSRLRIFLIFLQLNGACTTVYISQKKYHKTDTIIVKDYVIESISRLGNQDYEFDLVDYDSIFNVFKESIKVLDLSFIFKEGKNQINTENFQTGKLRFEYIDTSKIKSLGKEYFESLVLIPVISIKNNYRNTHNRYKEISQSDFLTSSLVITIYLLYKNKIIYASSSYTAPQISNPYNEPVSTSKIHTKEDWEIVAKKAFRKYLKRLNEK